MHALGKIVNCFGFFSDYIAKISFFDQLNLTLNACG